MIQDYRFIAPASLSYAVHPPDNRPFLSISPTCRENVNRNENSISTCVKCGHGNQTVCHFFGVKKKEKNVRHRSREVPRRPNEGRDMLCHWFDESLVCTELNKNNFSFFFSVPYGSHTTTFTLIQNTAISNEKDTSLKARSARNTNYCSRVNEACASLVSKPKKN